MKKTGWTILIIVIVLILAGGYRWYSHHGKNEAELTEAESKPVATVKTVPIKKGTIDADITVYGTVIPAPGAVQTISVPFESRILRVLVSEGQKVSRKAPLVEFEPSPDTRLQLEQAKNAFQSSQETLKHIQEQFNLKFANNEQLLTAKQAFTDAKLKLESLQHRGIDGKRTIPADFDALVTKVNVQDGALLPAGGSMVELIAPENVEVRLGVEVQDVKRLHLSQAVFLRPVNAPPSETMQGNIRTISKAVNTTTRLVDVFVALPKGKELFLDSYVLGNVKVASADGLIVPRTAVLPEEDSYVLFTVKNGHAVKHVVQPGLENDKEMIAYCKEIEANDPVVVLGNYELKDGMEVKEGK